MQYSVLLVSRAVSLIHIVEPTLYCEVLWNFEKLEPSF